MTPIGWEYALWMWVYALVWFVIDNTSKMLVYRLLRSRNPA
jgi:H+-transporting ATPase